MIECMQEFAELRVIERNAHLIFDNNEGVKLGDSIRKVVVNTANPLYSRIGAVERQLNCNLKDSLFLGWRLFRKYKANELKEAELFHLKITSVFEPAGEESGTLYDEISACPYCGAGVRQVGPLILNLNRIPKNKDFSRTIAGEIVVSRRVVDLFNRNEVDNIALTPVIDSRRPQVKSDDWFQLQVISSYGKIISPTLVGNSPFDYDENDEYRCGAGHLLGLNLLSEVFIDMDCQKIPNIFMSKQYVGVRRGLLRPQNILFVSKRIMNLLKLEKIKGYEIEIARIMNSVL